ncbi:MAG: methyltransferase domain-containing protein [Candidatus Omnitrophica bacterium]|nr:methyltransferase domain-containing protein [Candidatus Omnitrophota bacterium]
MKEDQKEYQRAQREIFNKSFAKGPFSGVVAELSYQKRISFTLKFIPDSSTILDFGCGDGRVTKDILTRAKKVVAIDISEKAIEVAKKFNNHPNIKYINTTIEDFSSEEKFDAVIMFEIIEHIYDPKSIFHKAKNLLKEDGVIILSTPNFLRLTRRVKRLYGIKHIRRRMGKDADRICCDHVREFSYQEVKDMLIDAGFEILAYEGVILWTDTIGGDLLRSVYWVQRLNFYLGSLIPPASGHIFIAAKKI